MANTIMTAKNTFAEGLIMDFAPDNTQATCMTSALNATLLTFNGNEMSLQNDMGNGRVETAFLPEGYVPVGTCEFGDIIYIVSYNPIINKSQIGCFPSPERNITSEEVGNLDVNLSSSDFQVIANNKCTGQLKASSVKKILYNKSMNPGDKYIIYADSKLQDNANYLSDYGNSDNLYGSFPKFTKIHIVAIEDSGKINFLDSSIKWYDNDYYIQALQQDKVNMAPDIDSYRSLVSSAYSIFQSKVSGKLALLIELERIQTFDCSYTIYTSDDGNNKTYKVYYNTSWQTDNNNINPSEIVITQAEWPNAEFRNGSYYIDSTKVFDYSWKPGQYHYGAILSRIYNPEDNISYSDYIQNYEYNSVINNNTNINNPNNAWGITKDQNSWPQTLLQKVDNNGLPITNNNSGVYYINAKYKNKDKYYYYKSDGEPQECKEVVITDDLVNNFFNKSVTKNVFDISLPHKTISNGITTYYDLSNFVWNYSIAPAMPYGVLEDLTISGTIDFSKIGTGFTNLTEWRYYNDGEVSTLKWGMDAYPEQGKKITQVRFEFYDNQGLAASYKIANKDSYSGSFTEVIQLGSDGVNPNILITDINNNIIKHLGDGPFEVTSNEDINTFIELVNNNIYIPVIKSDSNDPPIIVNDTINSSNVRNYYYYVNDAGCLYPNILYLVNIYVDYQAVDNLGEPIGNPDRRCYCRSYWTNTLMNRYYYNSKDFNNIIPSLDFKLDSAFVSNSNFQAPNPESNPNRYIKNNMTNIPESGEEETIILNTMGTVIQEISSKGSNNVNLIINPLLEDSYNSFAFDEDYLSEVNYLIGFGNEEISVPEQTVEYSEYFSDSHWVKTKISETTESIPQTYPNTYSTGAWEDWFTLTPLYSQQGNPNITYYDIQGEEHVTQENYYTSTNALAASSRTTRNNSVNSGIPFILQGNMFSKIAGTSKKTENINAIVYKPIIHELDDFNKYNIVHDESRNTFYFNNFLVTGVHGDETAKPLLSGGGSSSGDYGGLTLPSISTDSDGITNSANIKIGQVCIDKNIDVGMFSMLTFWCYSGNTIDEIDGDSEHRDGWVEIRTSQNNQYSAKKWKNKWHCEYKNGSYIYNSAVNKDSANSCIRYPAKKKENRSNGGSISWEDSLKSIHTCGALVVKNNQGNYVLYNNFFSFLPSNSGKQINQRLSYNSTNWGSTGKYAESFKGCHTMAHVIASLLAKIYIRSSQTDSTPVNVVSNIINCSDYSELWKKDIIVKTSYQGEINKLLSITGINYQIYLSQLYNNYVNASNKNQDYLNSITSININFDKIHTIQFQYSLSSQLDTLKKAYNINSISGERYLVYKDITNTYKGSTLTEPPFVGDIAFLNGEELVTNGVTQFPAINISGKNVSNTNNIINFSYSVLSRLQVKDDMIEFPSGVSQSSSNNYRIYMIAGHTKDTKNQCYITFSRDDYFVDESDFKLV